MKCIYKVMNCSDLLQGSGEALNDRGAAIIKIMEDLKK